MLLVSVLIAVILVVVLRAKHAQKRALESESLRWRASRPRPWRLSR
jgi:hypothetical protein